MKRFSKSILLVLLFELAMVYSCNHYSGESFLKRCVFINEETGDKIEFGDKDKIFFMWSSDIDFHWRKGHTYEYSYWLSDDNRIVLGRFSTSGEALHFPYKTLKLSDSKEEVFFTDRNGKSGVFKRKK